MNGNRVVCFGVSHHTASVEVRERIRFALFDVREMLISQRHRNGNGRANGNGNGNGNGHHNGGVAGDAAIHEVVLLSTCNRVELYATVEDTGETPRDLLVGLVVEASREARRRAGFDSSGDGFTRRLLDDVTRYYENDDAVRHLFKVACGLESMMLGETQILTQINEAYEDARDAGLCGPVLSAVFRGAHRVGKKARRRTRISRNASSISSAAVAIARETVGNLERRDIAVVGLGEMGQLALKTFYARGARHLHIVNRTFERAEALAEHITFHTPANVTAHRLRELPEVLRRADLVVTVTGMEDWIVDRDMVRAAQRDRNGRELVLIDIAVPRNVEPAVGDVEGVRLFDTNDIESVKEGGIAARRREIPKVESIIEEEMESLQASLRKVELKPLITELRKKAEAIRRRELERTYRKLGSPDPETWAHVQRLTTALVNKLYHYPTSIIREKATLGQADAYAATIRELFGLSATSGDGSDGE